ncbi:ankyrin repeat and LEM domain-containing protein 2-like [Gigantopelta aegis]|uniref:ankyrin repeat and LEM domain-containing protein 2-like n=1 Tax=Gigantopelta aegis TaxID=1735272 RepID=UPI001B88D666|nr:ankyrin repeat and LEM domain-containing protein 2-like [Gigantopelta aegis]
MEDVLNSVKSLSVAELREQLIDRGHKIGPVTSTTKSLFQRKLANLIYKDKYGDVSGNEVQIESKSSETTSRPPEKSCTVVCEEMPSVYYGISLADGDAAKLPHLTDDKLIFTDKIAAFAVAKEHPGSRFKAFKTFDEASNFVKKSKQDSCSKPLPTQTNGNDGAESSKSSVVVERSVYKAPKMRDLVVLRTIIESGDEHQFTSLVWSNPRYLVSSGDTPVILHEGQRYNALHTASKANQANMCRRILETILDPEFTKQLYEGSSDSEETQARRVQFLADLYLNMPDRGNGESPLHFASKFGFPDVVEVLVGYSSTDRNMRNRYGETPQDMICSRCQSPLKNVQDRIMELLQGLCYVPLLRSTDNTSAPLIGQPWSPDQSISPVMHLGKSPIDPQLTVRARAGPMSPSKAHLFYRQWSSPRSHSPVGDRKTVASIKREDGDKGLERIGRQLAHEMRIPWLEYWEFLDAFVDLGAESGVTELEKHFKKQQSALTFTQCLQNIHPEDILQSSSVSHHHGDLGSSFVRRHNKSLIQASSLSASGGVRLQGSAVESHSGCSNGDNHKNQSYGLCGSGDSDQKKVAMGDSTVKNGLGHPQPDGSGSFGNLTSTPKLNTWSYRQQHPSGEPESPETKSACVNCDDASAGEEDSVMSGQTVTHIRASLFHTPDSITPGPQTDTPTSHQNSNSVTAHSGTRIITSHPGDGEEESALRPSGQVEQNCNQSLSTDEAGLFSQRREESNTPNTWAYRRQSSETEQTSPTAAADVRNSEEDVELSSSKSNNDENIILVSLSKLKLSNGEEDPATLSTNTNADESSVFSSPKTPELSFNTNLSNLCNDFETKLMFTPENTKLFSTSPTTMPYGQITLNLGKSHHAAETFRRISDLKVMEEEDDSLSLNAPVIVLIKRGVPPASCDSEKHEIVVDVWVSKDEDLKTSVNNVFPDIVVSLQSQEFADRLLGLESPRLVTVDVTCEEKYNLRQHTVPVQALFLKTDLESNFNIHILGLRHSKTDLDVYRAIKDTPIDASKFPLTHRWMERMMMLSADTKQSWPSPSRLRSEARLSKNTSCLSPLVTGSSSFRSKRLAFSPLSVDGDPRTVLFPVSPKLAAHDS